MSFENINLNDYIEIFVEKNTQFLKGKVIGKNNDYLVLSLSEDLDGNFFKLEGYTIHYLKKELKIKKVKIISPYIKKPFFIINGRFEYSIKLIKPFDQERICRKK